MSSQIFQDCLNLKSVKFPDNMKTLPVGTFLNCTSLREVELPDSITEIEDSALNLFYLERVRIGNNVEKIGNMIFCDFNTQNYRVKVYTDNELVKEYINNNYGSKISVYPYNEW